MRKNTYVFLLICFGLIVGIPYSYADQLRMYSEGKASLAAHLNALDRAQHSIDILSYEFEPCDSTGKFVLDALVRKASQGVRVRFILDDFLISSAKKHELAGFFQDQGIDFRIYNSFKPNINHRSHIKSVVIDGRFPNGSYFADSSNLTDAYFGIGGNRLYLNRDFEVRGHSVLSAQMAFDLIYSHPMVKPVPRKISTDRFKTSCLKKSNKDKELRLHLNRVLKSKTSQKIYSCKVSYFADDPDFLGHFEEDQAERGQLAEEYMHSSRLHLKRATAETLKFIEGSKRWLMIENQYYLPQYKLKKALANARDHRGVNILVLTNGQPDAAAGMGKILSYFVSRAAKRDTKLKMAVLPLTFETENIPTFLHSKTVIRDHKDIWAGSFNLDLRSYNLNLEYGIRIENCPKMARVIEGDLKRMAQAFTKKFSTQDPQLNPIEWLLGFLVQAFL